jgi:hypothetical protein
MGTLTNRAGDTSPPTPTTHDDVLEAVSFALSSRLELGEVLNLLARLARRSTAASRASVLLVDRGRLVPAASVGPEPDAELFAAFRAMAPLRSSELPPLAVLLDAGVPRAIADARQDDTIPAEWVRRFGIVGCALVPLRAGDEVAGLMAVDHPEAGWFDDGSLRVLATLGRYAGVAVRDARVHEESAHRATLMTQVAASAGALAQATEVGPLARALADAGRDLLGARDAAVVLLDRGGTRARIVPATGERSTRATERDRLPRAVRDALAHGRAEVVAGDASEFDWDAGHVALAPLTMEDRVRGVLVCPVDPADRHLGAAVEAIATLASIGAAAIERVLLTREVRDTVWRLGVLAGLGVPDVGDDEAPLEALDTRLGAHGIELVEVRLDEPELARTLDLPIMAASATAEPDPVGDGPHRLHDGSVVVPLRSRDATLGTLHVRPVPGRADDPAFLSSIGQLAGDRLERAALRRRLDGAARVHARVDERDRLVDEVAVGLEDLLEELEGCATLDERTGSSSPLAGSTARRVRDLSATAHREVEELRRAAAHLPSETGGTTVALRALLAGLAGDAGIDVTVRVDELLDRLADPLPWTTARVVHRAVVRSWFAGRATVVTVDVACDGRGVTVRVCDDGIGLGNGEGSLVGAFGVRRLVTTAGGRLHVERAGAGANVLVVKLPVPPDHDAPVLHLAPEMAVTS